MATARIYENQSGGAARRNHIPWIEGGHVAWFSLEAAQERETNATAEVLRLYFRGRFVLLPIYLT
jgi:hypothetical protein